MAKVEAAARAAIAPLVPAHAATIAPKNFLFTAQRAASSQSLPEHYLTYFLLVDLLGFTNLGSFEKIAWSVPVNFNGQAFLIEHRKFGLGIFTEDLQRDAPAAIEIARLINAGVAAAEPYFEWLADQAADGSDLNVSNRSSGLFERHKYFLDQYRSKRAEAEARKDECIVTQTGPNSTLCTYPSHALRKEANWLALASIETFFSWTEHVFIHIGILRGRLLTGREVKRAANDNWASKFDLALDRSDRSTQAFFDELVIVRQQIRNFDAHGSFGKQREAFSFHSSAGAVPLRLPHQQDVGSMRFGSGAGFVDDEAIKLIENFTDHLWSGDRSPAELYIQKSGLPLILTFASNGTYAKAMTSDEEMALLCDYLSDESDRHANMDF